MTESSAFLDAIADLEITFTTDRHAARRAFPAALALATPAEREFLDRLANTFTLHPFETAMKVFDAQYAAEPENRDRLVALVPETDPALFIRDRADRLAEIQARATRNNTSVEDEYSATHVGLPAAELPRTPMRQWRNPPARTYLAPRRDTEKSRGTAEQIKLRSARRSKRRPVEVEPDVVTQYVAENLYADTVDAEMTDARAAETRARERGLLARPQSASWIPRFPGDKPPLDSEEARTLWNHLYVGYVAEQHQHALALALAGKSAVSDDRALADAATRTTLHGYSDRRTAIPFQGNGLDYDHEAMNPVRGWRCVSCFIERADTDQHITHTHTGPLRSDDGLCDLCRADGRPGLPPLPAGFTARDLARAYMRFFADTYPQATRGLLAEVRRRAPQWLIALIDEFLVTAALPGATPTEPDPQPPLAAAQRQPRRRGPVLGAGQRTGRCDACTRITAVNADNLCTPCLVWIGLDTPTPRHHAA
ncbi:hypothetical protein ACFXO9_26685 [Nocardia tengchongensis]|uniref:hypothetical protein n=1 Tax=Nocardia tengchongensis TaxID=2055889 RepID=UPI0036999186